MRMLSITFVGRAAMSELNRRYLRTPRSDRRHLVRAGTTGETRRRDRRHLHLSGDRPRQREAAGRADRGGDPETRGSRHAARPRARPSDRSVAHHFAQCGGDRREFSPVSSDRLIEDFNAGKPAALARVVSIVENHRDGFEQILGSLHPRTGRARRIGITGPPGAGKSTITALLVKSFREQGLTVGVIAVDPTSPFTGGALLGDRIRMESVALDPGVFIRSMATRGSLGGLAAATREVATCSTRSASTAPHRDGRRRPSELDVARTADSTVVVLVPESGDSIQTLKAGLMEIADIFVVNKADRPGADRLRNEIELMLGLREGRFVRQRAGAPRRRSEAHQPGARSRAKPRRRTDPAAWTPPVLRAVATKERGNRRDRRGARPALRLS